MLITDDLLFHFKRCRRRAFLDVYGRLEEKKPEKDFIGKLRQEKESLDQYILSHLNLNYQQPDNEEDNPQVAIEATTEMMRQGVDCIYQGKLHWQTHLNDFLDNPVEFLTSPRFLLKQDIPSNLGNWSYQVANTHLGKQTKPEYKLMGALQTHILGQIQGLMPDSAHIILRNRRFYQVNLAVWQPRSQELVKEIVLMLNSKIEPEVYISRQKCHLCPWYDSCHFLAKSQQHLSLIPTMTPKRYELFKQQGINNLPQLARLSITDVKKIIDSPIAVNLYQQTQSLWHNQPYLKSSSLPEIPSSPIELFFDIEAEPDRKIDYLLGVLLVDNQTNTQNYYSFLAESLNDEQQNWQNFLNWLQQYPNSPIFHYSEYEAETMKRLAYLYHTPPRQLQSILDRLVDIHRILIKSVFLPVENYSLKAVGNWLGCSWQNSITQENKLNSLNIGGDQCIFWYDQWLKTGNVFYLESILKYNQDDCFATYKLTKWLRKFQLKSLFTSTN